LDRLIERATRHNPDERPTMVQVRDELQAWLAPPPAPREFADLAPGEFADLAPRFAAVTAPDRRAVEVKQLAIAQEQEAFQRLRERVNQLSRALGQAGLGEISSGGFPGVLAACRLSLEQDDWLWTDEHSFVLTGPDHRPALWGGVWVRLYKDERLHMLAVYATASRFDSSPEVLWSDRKVVPVGSAREQQAVADLVSGLASNLRAAVERYTQLAEG